MGMTMTQKILARAAGLDAIFFDRATMGLADIEVLL